MQPKQVKTFLVKINTFIDIYTDVQFSAFGQKEIKSLLGKDFFKIFTLEDVTSTIQIYNSCFVEEIKDLSIDKAYEKKCLVIYAYNDKEKIFVLKNSPKIPGVNQSISCYFASII